MRRQAPFSNTVVITQPHPRNPNPPNKITPKRDNKKILPDNNKAELSVQALGEEEQWTNNFPDLLVLLIVCFVM